MSHASRDQSDTSHSKFEWLRRIGYGGKGALYFTLGLLIAFSVIAANAKAMGFRDAISWIADQPFGIFLVALVGLGLVAYAVYRFLCAALDFENEGSDKKGVGKRIGYFCSGLAYTSLAVSVATLLAGGGAGKGGEEGKVALLIGSLPGKILLGAIVIGLLVAAFQQVRRAWTGQFRERFDWSELPSGLRRFVSFAAKFGLTARGLIFSVLAYLLALALIRSDAEKAGGMEDALKWFSENSAGPWVLGSIALGLAGYGVYAFAIAWCGRRVGSQ